MARKKQKQVSAQVMLRSASGATPEGTTSVTVENVHQYLPSSSSITEARQAFANAGFEVGPVVGNSFSITALKRTFEKVARVRLTEDKMSGVRAQVGEQLSYELPIEKLPEDLRRHVAAVTFTAPPDFGPTNYSY